MEERLKNGLCYHCDEKWQSGHQCKGERRIEGKIQGQSLVILIDTSSTHSFLDARLCSSLKLAINLTLAFDVKIANRVIVRTLNACQDLQVQV